MSLAAADAVLDAYGDEDVPARIGAAGQRWLAALADAGRRFPALVRGVRGIPEFAYLDLDAETGQAVSRACARRGVLFKRDAYNFISLSHTTAIMDRVLHVVGEALEEVAEDECAA